MIRKILVLLAVPLAVSCAGGEPGTEYFELSNGIRVIIAEDSSAETAAVHVFMPGSRLLEEDHNAGIISLTAAVWTRGAAGMTSEEISSAFESLGARFGITAHPDFTAASLTTIPGVFEEAFGVFSDVLLFPSFPDEELERERTQQERAARRLRDSLFDYAYGEFRELFYGSHPYGLPELGTANTLREISRDDIISHRNWLLSPAGMVISAAGNLNKAKIRDMIEESFSGIEEHNGVQPSLPEFRPPGKKIHRVNVDSRSAWLLAGFPAPASSGDDYAAVKVLNAALGGGMSSRLFRNIREKRGLAYSAGSFYPTRLEPSHLTAYAVLEAAAADEALKEILREIENLKRKKLPAVELRRAKNYIKGRHFSGQETPSDRAWNAAWFELLGMGFHYMEGYIADIEAVTADQVKKAAAAHLGEPSVILIGPGVED